VLLSYFARFLSQNPDPYSIIPLDSFIAGRKEMPISL
jgi:hypothetical protein